MVDLLAVLISRVGNISIPQAFRLISFLTFPATALGIYFLALTVSHRKTVGLIASVLYLLSPLSWTWIADGGMYSVGLGLVFLPIALACYVHLLARHYAPSPGGARRLWLVALVISICGASVSDPRVGATTVLSLLAFAAFPRGQSGRASKAAESPATIGSLAVPALLAALCLSFFIVPVLRYTHFAMADVSFNWPEMIGRLPPQQFIGVAPVEESAPLRIQFPLPVVFLFTLGALVVGLGLRRGTGVYLPAVLGIAVVAIQPVGSFLDRLPGILALFVGVFNWLMLLIVLLPIGAALGAWSVAWVVLHPRAFLRFRGSRGLDGGALPVWGTMTGPTSMLSILIVGVALPTLGSFIAASPGQLAFGPLPGGVQPADIWDRGGGIDPSGPLAQLDPGNWPSLTLSSEVPAAELTEHLRTAIPAEGNARLDVSPNLAQEWRIAATDLGTSRLGTSDTQLSLIRPASTYDKRVLFTHDLGVDEYGNSTSLNEVANWYGINYVMLDPQLDRIQTYEAAGWHAVDQEASLEIWRPPQEIPLASVTSKPTILVLGKPDGETYTSIFRLANNGLLGYESAILAEGRKKVDQYTLEELEPVDVIVMVDYDYSNSRKAWDLLKAYVEQGGSLFVDTGWQYAIPEWEFGSAPEILPVSQMEWTYYGMGTDYSLEAEDIAGYIDVSRLKPLDWEGQPWDLSGTWRQAVRDWGEVVLSFADRPLIVAGRYGNGRVVWSGMNLLGHAQYLGTNQSELELLGNLVGWAPNGRVGADLKPPVVVRDFPDRVDFLTTGNASEETWLYWREAYYPNWHAYTNDGTAAHEVPIYRGGPGFMLMPVESNGGALSVRLVWELSWPEKAAIGLSAAGILLLLALFLDGLLLDGNGFTWLRIALTMRMPSPILDEEANLEMAEAQKAELERRRKGLHFGRRHASQTGRKVQQVTGAGAAPTPQMPAFAPHSDETPPDERLDGDQQALLQSWLESTGHADDAWASRLIGRKNIAVHSKPGKRP